MFILTLSTTAEKTFNTLHELLSENYAHSNMSSTWFGCQKCPFHFATMELALNHLLQSPNHQAEIVDLVGQYNAEYLSVAARSMLFSFTKNIAAEHEASVAQADVGSLPRTSSNTPSPPKKELTRHAPPVGGDHHTIRGKRRRLVGSSSRIDVGLLLLLLLLLARSLLMATSNTA